MLAPSNLQRRGCGLRHIGNCARGHVLGLQATHQFGDRWDIVNQSDALPGAPDGFPRFDLWRQGLSCSEVTGLSPNLLARSLIKGESGIVGVIIGNARNPLFWSALDSLSAHLSPAGKHILFFTADGNSPADEQVEGLLKYRVDALVLMAASLSPKLAGQCRDEGIPVISFNRPPRKMKGFISVAGNNREGARQIAEHLLQQGYRRLAFMAGFTESSTGRERETAFTEYMASQGLPPPEREVGHCNREGALQAARNLLARKPRPDAIFCANDYMALAAIEVARYEFGLEIGPDIGIAGFDDIEEAAWPSFELTTYSLPLAAMIEKVAATLLGEPPAAADAHMVIEGHLKIRGSTQRSRDVRRVSNR